MVPFLALLFPLDPIPPRNFSANALVCSHNVQDLLFYSAIEPLWRAIGLSNLVFLYAPSFGIVLECGVSLCRGPYFT